MSVGHGTYLRGLAVLALATIACDCEQAPVRPLEIGWVGLDDGFRPFEDGDPIDVFLLEGVEGASVSLRVPDTHWPDAEFSIELEMEQTPIAVLVDRPIYSFCDPDGCVLRDRLLLLTPYPCCYHCANATLRAQATAGDGQQFSGSVTVVPKHADECPATLYCCDDASACPDELSDVLTLCR